MRGSGTVQVINNNEKLGLPWICRSIYNAHLSPSPRPAQQPREIRAPFTASACAFIFNWDAVIGRQPGGTSVPVRLLRWLLGLVLAKQRMGLPCCPASPGPEPSGERLPAKRNPIKALFRYLKVTGHAFAVKKGGRGKKKPQNGPHTLFLRTLLLMGPQFKPCFGTSVSLGEGGEKRKGKQRKKHRPGGCFWRAAARVSHAQRSGNARPR